MLDENRLEDLVADCLDRIATEGITALDDVCREHPDYADAVRAEVEAARSLGLIDASPTEPETLGEFRVIERLGEGGMGLVYLAEQGPLGRHVAVKVIRPEFATMPGARERLRREARAAAQLRHPSIVPIIAVGEEGGVPYFAMEHVTGVSLDRVLGALEGKDPADLSGEDLADVVERLTGESVDAGDGGSERGPFDGQWAHCVTVLLAQAARAVAHAHAHGVLHRDVKPSNLMLTPGGRVVLLDFGLALRETASRMTRSGYQPGSLLYMAPEQVQGRGGDVDVRTDVYALGVTFYELLALQTPFGAATPEEVRARILAGDAPRPSARHRGLAWDVETVCLVAMEVDPDRRFATAVDLARDLENVLDREPILARRPGTGIRLRRWITRSPARAAATLLALLAFVVAPTVIAVLESRAGRRLEARRVEAEGARDEARAELRRADASFGFLTHLIEETGGWSWVKRSAKLEALDADVERLIGEFADDPSRQARMMEDVSNLYWKLGLRPRSVDLLERALPVLRRERSGAELARTLEELGSRGVQNATGVGVAIERLDEALALIPVESSTRVLRAEVLQSLALARRVLTEPVSARDLLVRAAALLEGLEEEEGSQRLRTVRHEVAVLMMELGDHDGAERLFCELLLTADESGLLAATEWRIRLGEIYAQRGDVAEAEAFFRDGIDKVKPILGGSNPRVGVAKGRLGLLLYDSGRLEEAEALLRDATDLLGGTDVAPGLQGAYACRLATVLYKRERYEEAAEMSRRAVRLRSGPDGAPTDLAGHCLFGLVQSLYELGRREDALEAAKTCLLVNRRIGRRRLVGLTQRCVGAIHSDARRWSEARDALEEALEVFEASDVAEDARYLVWTLERLSFVCRGDDDPEAALEYAIRGVAAFGELSSGSVIDEARLHAGLGRERYLHRQYGAAIAPYERAIACYEKLGEARRADAAALAVRLAYCRIRTGSREKAESLLKAALTVLEATGRTADAAEARRLLGQFPRPDGED